MQCFIGLTAEVAALSIAGHRLHLVEEGIDPTLQAIPGELPYLPSSECGLRRVTALRTLAPCR